MADNHACTKNGELADLNARLNNVEKRQERHHSWTKEIEKECREGIDDVEKQVEEKYNQVITEIGKMSRSNLKMSLTIMGVFGSLFVILALIIRG